MFELGVKSHRTNILYRGMSIFDLKILFLLKK